MGVFYVSVGCRWRDIEPDAANVDILREQPLTIYPHALQCHVRAWVRFGPEAVRVDAKIVRSTPHAAGIEFRCEDDTYRCWVWGNATT